MAKRSREKAAARRESADKRPFAIARHVRISSMKAQAVAKLIRGLQVDEALALLQNTNKSAAPLFAKVLNSAVANAENNQELDRNNLYVFEAKADQGPKMKRWRAGSRGMAKRYIHYTSHLSVKLDEISKETELSEGGDE
jgi:large subunit ribosomal protein L22